MSIFERRNTQGDILERSGAQSVEAEAFTGVHNGQLAGHGQDGTLTSGVGQLWSGSANQSNHTGSVDNATTGLLVATQREDGVLATEPDALDVDIVCEVPDLLGGVDGIRIVSVHNTSVIEDHIGAAPAVLGLDHCLHVGFLGHVALEGLHTRGSGNNFLHLGQCLGEGSIGDISHEDVGSLAGEEDGGFETNTTIHKSGLVNCYGSEEETYPPAPVMMAFLP